MKYILVIVLLQGLAFNANASVNLDDPNLAQIKDQRELSATAVLPGIASKTVLNSSSSSQFSSSSSFQEQSAAMAVDVNDRVAK